MRRKCERRRGSANADGAGAEVFVGDRCSQGASFIPMTAISRRGQGGRIYNNTRTREPLRRKCVKPADRTTHSPPKTCSRPSTATRPSRAFSHSLPAHFHSPRSADARPQAARCTPADLTTHSPSKICSRPRTATRSSRPRPPAPAAPTHTRRLRDAFPADLTTHSPPKPSPRPRTATRLARALPLPHAAPTRTRRLHNAFLADLTTHSSQRLAASPSVPLRAQKNGTAQWMCDAECLGRPSLRSVIGVGEPCAVRRRCGALAWCVGLRPQPWALRSRRCGRVLRA